MAVNDEGSGSNLIIGNIIGLNATGDAAIPNGNGIVLDTNRNIIGGIEDGAGNVISGNSLVGITITGDDNEVQGNLIGLNATGTTAIPNEIHGIEIGSARLCKIGGTADGEGNVISGNGGDGIHIGSDGNENTIQGNTIGLNITGDTAVPNVNGIYLGADESIFMEPDGGSTTVQGNIIGLNPDGDSIILTEEMV